MTDFGSLQDALTGEVIEPGAPAYEQARRPAMPQFWHIRPQAVVRCASANDVALALAFARRSGLHVVPRGGGHCFAGRSSTDGVVLDLRPLRSVSVSDTGVATIGAGARLAEVYDALDEHGLTLPAGCGPTVGIAGLTLGGGLGILGRRYGLTSDRLLAAQVVLADGRIVHCDKDRSPDLFWALRGAGGGQFGVVTSLVFDPVPAPEATRFVMTWPANDAAAVVAAWQDWAPDAPDEMSASLKIVAAADGRVSVILFGAMLGSSATVATARLDELISLVGARPASSIRAGLPYRDLKRSFDSLDSPSQPDPDKPSHVSGADPADPLDAADPVLSKSEFFRQSLPASAIIALLEALVRDVAVGQRRELNFTPMGGAYNRVAADATAFVHRTERFLLEHAAVHPAPGSGAAARWVRASWNIAHPWGSGRVYPNFPDRDLAAWAEAYHGSNHDRLVRVKRAYDPERLLRFDRAI